MDGHQPGEKNSRRANHRRSIGTSSAKGDGHRHLGGHLCGGLKSRRAHPGIFPGDQFPV